jgi:hypothetical protein
VIVVVSEERLRRDLEHIAPPADPSGVVERVLARASRRRLLRRVQAGGLAFIVIAGAVAGTLGLSRVFAPSGRIAAADRRVEPSPEETASSSGATSLKFASGQIAVCHVSSVQGDFFGDGRPDTAFVFVVAAIPGSCPESAQTPTMIGVQPDGVGIISITAGPIDCPGGCRAIAAADIDGDGRADIGVVAGQNGSTQVLTGYRVVDRTVEGGIAAIERIPLAGPDLAQLEAGVPESIYPAAAGSSCPSDGMGLELTESPASAGAAAVGDLAERYRDWLALPSHTSGVRAGQDAALLTRIAATAVDLGLSDRAVRAVFAPSFSWGLNDPNGGGNLLRFLSRNPDLLRRVLDFAATYHPNESKPYFDMNPGATYQSAFLRGFPELHAAYTVMAEGRNPFSDFWETEGNLLPLATIAGQDDRLGRMAADILRSLQQGLEQAPGRNYFFVGGEYSGPESVVSLRADLAAFVRAWHEGPSEPAPDPCDQAM